LSDLFDLSHVATALADIDLAYNLRYLPSVGSTNMVALEAAQLGAAHGSVWVADEQTAGRGRSDHRWHSPLGEGLYISVLLRPQMALADALWLSLATALAVQAAIANVTGLAPDIRWPNDILIGSKKCSGILVETSAIASDTPAILRYAVIGVGINVNQPTFPAELQAVATSLRRESGGKWSREAILIEFLRALDKEVAWLEAELRETSIEAGLLERFTASSSWVRGKHVSVSEAGGYTGVTDGLDARGFLRVVGDDGMLHTVLSGGVRAL